MPSISAIQKMNKLLDNRKFRMKDSDKDGVPDMFDCRPHNPRKQGVIHTIAAAGARTFLKGERRKYAEAYIEKKRKQSEEIRKIREKERHKQRLETARYQERIAGERRRKYIAAGGLGGELRRGFVGVGRALAGGPVIASPRLARAKRSKKTKKTKKRIKKRKKK